MFVWCIGKPPKNMLAPSILLKQSIKIDNRESSIDVLHLQCKGDVESVNARPDKVCWMNQDVVLYYSSVWGFCLFFLFFTDFTTNLILTKNNPPINWHLIFLIFQFEVSGFFNWIWICNNVWFLTNQLHVYAFLQLNDVFVIMYMLMESRIW